MAKKTPVSKAVRKTVKENLKESTGTAGKSAEQISRNTYRNSAKTPKIRKGPRNLQVPKEA